MAAKATVAKGSAIATEHLLASKVGIDAMKAGGNAFDAAVAASFALGVVLPHLSGLGGDFFALFYDSKRAKVRCLNGSGWAPSGCSLERIRSKGVEEMPTFGAQSVVIPGLVAGVEEMHRSYGRLEFGALLNSAVKLAEDGFPISPGLSRAVDTYMGSLPRDAKRAFGDGLGPNSVLKQGALAERLREVADGGSAEFYQGEAAEEMRALLEGEGVGVSREDFAFTPEWTEPIQIEYRGRQVFEVPPNSMGAAALMILRQLEEKEPPPADSLERVRLVTEATRVALSAKDRFLGDPRFVDVDLSRFLGSRERSKTSVSPGDTTYFAVADSEGNLLSCIQSLFHPFGSRLYLPKSGFFLNNRASSFKFAGPNQAAPRKRPVHTLSALLLSKRKGDIPYLAMGTSGGEMRPQLHALFVSNVVDYSMDIEKALGYPRFVWNGYETEAEKGYRVEGDTGGLRMVDYPTRQGVAQGIELTPLGKKAVCDIRGDGEPAAF
ncbi:MAG TPA: gamma-glutamyltransferase family protein [Nitrososphaerales archaeon]|nr:gamma-glutamyltransferase family protein [Nitrososphaerales archaeon]